MNKHINQTHMNRLVLISLMMILTVFSCETIQDINVGITWLDDNHFNSDSSRYLGIAEGEYDLDTGFETTLIELARIIPGDDAIHTFSLPSNNPNNYTAFVFIDLNSNASYDEGYDVISGYKYNCVEPGECLNISVSAYY